MPIGNCKLCMRHSELKNSHLIPAAVFKSLRSEGEDVTSITAKRIVQTSRHFQAHLFCGDCEGRLNKNGENYVLSQMARQLPEPEFRLYDLLTDEMIYDADDDCRVYEARDVPEIDAGKLAHFALGMLWKTTACDWVGVDGYIRRLDLGPYEDPIRRFLLGEAPFPKHCFINVFVWPDKPSVVYGTYLPRLHHKRQSHVYSYYLPGITFVVRVGKSVEQKWRELCCFSNERKPIAASIYIAEQNASLLGQLWNFPRKTYQWPRIRYKVMQNNGSSTSETLTRTDAENL